jgi:hypothetical protein
MVSKFNWMIKPSLFLFFTIPGSHLKTRILVLVRGGAEFKTAGLLKYFEDFKRGTNKEIGPKDCFEIASNLIYPQTTLGST